MIFPEHAVNRIACFYPNAQDVVRGLPRPGATQWVGTVVAARPNVTQRGSLPDLCLRVQGRGGNFVEVSLVEHHVRLFEDWKGALEEQAK